MPAIVVSDETWRLIADQLTPGFTLRSDALRLADGMWRVTIDDEVAAAIEAARMPGETDDDVVGRLVRATMGKRPD